MSAPGFELALSIACLREPVPESSVFVTVKVEAGLVIMSVAALALLPIRQRTVVVLRYHDDLSEADVRRVMAHPTTMIGSDGVPAGGKPHPRLYGTFARVLGHYVREERVLDLPTAIHRMTGMPAAW